MVQGISVGLGFYSSYSGGNASSNASSVHRLTVQEAKELDNKNVQNPQIDAMKRSGQIECETCKNRKYQDGSDEMVSFKAAGHISPEASASKVRAHEQEHVSNAFEKAAKNDGRVVSANVSLKTAVCPECGKSYVSGGLTTTQIQYDESNPYSKNQKSLDNMFLLGQNVDLSA